MQQPATLQMSERWEEKRDPQTGNSYWVDHMNQCSTWTNPFAPNNQPVQQVPAPQAQQQPRPNMYTQGAAGAFGPPQQYNQDAPPGGFSRMHQNVNLSPQQYNQPIQQVSAPQAQQSPRPNIYTQGAPPGGFSRMPVNPGQNMIQFAMDQATENASKNMFGFKTEQNQYNARLTEARKIIGQQLSPQNILTVDQYRDIVVRPTKFNENFQRTWKAIYTMQNNGVAVILPRMSHHYDKGGEDDSGGVVVSDYVTLEKGFQLELTCVANKDWMTLATPLLQGRGITHSDIARIVVELNQSASRYVAGFCDSCCCLLCSIPCCCIPYCQWNDNKYRERHEIVSRRVANINAQNLHPHGLQLNYHVQPADFPQSYQAAIYYLSLTSTNPIFPQACFDAIPGNRRFCWVCCNVSDQIPAKIF